MIRGLTWTEYARRNPRRQPSPETCKSLFLPSVSTSHLGMLLVMGEMLSNKEESLSRCLESHTVAVLRRPPYNRRVSLSVLLIRRPLSSTQPLCLLETLLRPLSLSVWVWSTSTVGGVGLNSGDSTHGAASLSARLYLVAVSSHWSSPSRRCTTEW